MIDKDFIEIKLAHIQSYYKELTIVLNLPAEEIKKDFLKLRALERILQLIVDEIIDINSHFIRHAHMRVPDDFQSSFYILAENKVFPLEFAQKIAPVIGLRNRLVHRYEKIDIDTLIKETLINKEDFKEYVKYIFEFINIQTRQQK